MLGDKIWMIINDRKERERKREKYGKDIEQIIWLSFRIKKKRRKLNENAKLAI